jgi:hypothetical protein
MNRYLAILLFFLCSCNSKRDKKDITDFLYKPNLTATEFSQVSNYYSKLPIEDSSAFSNFKLGMSKERYDLIIDSMLSEKKSFEIIKKNYVPDSTVFFHLILDTDTLSYTIYPTFYNDRLCNLELRIYALQTVTKDLLDYHFKNYLLNVGKDTDKITRQDVHEYLYRPLKQSIQNYWLKIEDKILPLFNAKYGASQFIVQDSFASYKDYNNDSYWFKPGRMLLLYSPSDNDFKGRSENYFKVRHNYIPPTNIEEAYDYDTWANTQLFTIEWEDLKNYPLARKKTDQEIKNYDYKITEEANLKAEKERNDKQKADSSKASKVGF